MATAAVTAIETDDASVRQFLLSLFPTADVAATPSPTTSAETAAAPVAPGSVLRLHPRVDAAHPLGQAHTAQELEDALKLYHQLVQGMQLEVEDVLLGPDKALATGHLVVSSHMSQLASAGASALSATTSSLPHSLRSLTDSAAQLLPAGFVPGRVPITIQMRLGKSDAGDPVVTHISLVFSLLSLMLPHVALQPWQQHMLQQLQPQIMSLLLQAGSAASVAEDVGTSMGATWRAGTAVLQATVGQALAVAKEQAQHLWAGRGTAASPTTAGATSSM